MAKKTYKVNQLDGAGMVEQATISAEPCAHHNMHYAGPETLICDLPKGHGGDHECNYRGERTYWSDAAGSVPNPTIITPEQDELRRRVSVRRDLENK